MTWSEVSLKQICDVDWGNTKLTKSSYVANGEFLAVSAAGADGLIDYYEHEANVAVLSAIGAQCGRMFFPGERFTAIKNTITLTPKEGVSEGKFLYYLFTFVELPQRGAGQPFISKGDIEAFRVLIPDSLQEQREIVEKLDSAFAEIDLLEENLGSSDIKTNELLQSILSSAFTPEAEVDLSANQGSVVRTVRLSEISTFTRGLTYSKSDEVEHSNNIVLRANNIDLNTNSLNFDELRYIKDSIQIREDKIVMKDSIIICTASGSKSHVGKVALIDKDYGYAFGGFMGQITPTDKCNPKYLYYILISEKFKEFLMNLNDGTNINNLKFSDIANYELSLPSLEEQCEIVEKLDSAFAEIQSLKAQIRTKKDYAVSLRQSLLSSAFTQEEAVA
jgi:type I restriction enzyme S subunit